MQRRWQVVGQPDGSLVWVPASDAAPPAAAGLLLHVPSPAVASAGEVVEGSGADEGCSVQSMADLFTEARDKLLRRDGMVRAIEDAGNSGLFCTGSGKSVIVSERAIRRAGALVCDDAHATNNKRKQPFGDDADFDCGLRETDVSFRGGVCKDGLSPMFQTGSGKVVSLSKDSIQKARAVLEGNVGNPASAIQPMFHTGMARSVPVSRSSIDKAMAVLEGQTTGRQGDVAAADGMDQFPLFQTGSGRAVSVSVTSIQKAKAVLEENNLSKGNMEGSGRPDQSLMFQTGSRRPVLISERSSTVVKEGGIENIGFQSGLGKPAVVSQNSIQKARALFDEDVKRNGHGDASVCATTFQTETPRSVLMGGSLIMTDTDATPEGDGSIQAKKSGSDGHLPLFQTGLGRSVSVSKSSIKRASAILEPRNIAKELEDEARLDGGCATPMFKSGLGKSIIASENSRKTAHVVLEFEAEVKSEYKDFESPLPMFRTGSGKLVSISENSVQKARAVLEEEGCVNRDNHKQINMEKKFPIFASPLKASYTRTVNISSLGVSRAATLLGLEENTLSTQLFGHVGDKLGTKITVERENSGHRIGVSSVGCPENSCPAENMDLHQQFVFPKNTVSESGDHAIRFSTAGGRSMAISSDALQRAKSLLCESDLEVLPSDFVGHSLASACKEKLQNSTGTLKDEPDLSKTSSAKSKTEPGKVMADRKHTGSLEYAVPDITSTNGNAGRIHVAREYHPFNGIPKIPKPSSKCLSETDNASGTKDKTQILQMPARPLVDITNYMGTHPVNMDSLTNENTRIGGKNSISPFKRPRSSRFIAPINTKKPSSAGVSKVPIQTSPCRTKLSSCYPCQHQRKSCKEYFGGPPCFKYLKEHVTDEVKLMDATRAEKYKFNKDTGAEEFQKMLLACGASLTYATKEWVSNHYKWIVWKLASLERCYQSRAAGKFLTVANVLEELKYRYDREVNNGHRSSIKKILEGNASPSLMMVLCISAIYSCPDLNNSKPEVDRADTNEDSTEHKNLVSAKRNMSGKIELTDGWYSLDTSLDVALSEQLEKRKLFIGQKLRVWGASLCGWAGPVSFHESSGTVKLMIHMNGTYRVRWNETLGLCKHAGLPLAFKCIKALGGRVPRTLVGVARIYPVMYRERLSDGRSVVRSERMEGKALQLYHQRVSKIAEDILSEQEGNCESTDDEAGAKICKMLERAAEPEVMLAGMTSEQLRSFSCYQEKQKEVRQNEVTKKVEKALEAAGLSTRDVTPFLKVRVMGLISKHSATKSSHKEGLITIWNPTEKQKADLVEGQIYSVTGLVPSTYCTQILSLHARGSSTMWKPLASAQTTDFEPFFTPRKAVELLNFGEVPLAREFDIAGVILYVGNVYICSNQKRQWLFLTDGSKFISEQMAEEQDDCLLAVSFSSPTTGDDSAFFNQTLSGHVVGFSNLVKRQKDQMNHMWVADAADSSTYALSHEIPNKSHLKEAATSAEKWASSSHPIIQQLKERVLCIIGDSGG